MKLSKWLTFSDGTVQKTAASNLPSGIGPNAGFFDRLTSFYYPPGCENTLNQIGADVAVTQQGAGGLRRWAWIGASEVRFTPPATNVTSTTAPPMQLTRALQRFGLPCADGMASLMDKNNPDTRWTYTACTLIKVGSNAVGLFGNGAGSTATYKSLSPKTSFEFFWYDPGTLNGVTIFSYNVDGAGAVNVVGGPTAAVRRVAVTGLIAQVHTVVFTAVTATASAMCLFGANTYNANDLTIDNWGCSGSGASASGVNALVWDDTGTTHVYDGINVVIASSPSVVFVSLGANDYFNSGTLAGFKTALSNIISALQTAGSQVVLVGIYPFTNPALSPTDLPTTWRQAYYDLADTYSVPMVDLHDRWVDATKAFARGLLGNDTEVGSTYYIHPTPAGHSEMTNAMTDLIGPTQPSLPVNIFNATSDPTVTDDVSSGFTVGSRWVNTTTSWEFTALSVAAGAAVWTRISSPSMVAAVVPQPGASNILLPFTNSASAANVGGALNQGLWTPILLTRPTPISGLAFHVTTAASGGAAVVGRCAIFNDNGAGGVGTLIADYGTTAVTSTGLKTVAGARTLQPGIYWTGFKYEYTTVPTTAPQFTSMNSVQPLPGPAMNSINYRCLAASGISGAFTSNPAATPSTTNAPIVGIVVT